VLLALIAFASFGKILTFLVMLSVLIVLHEYGHFIVARRNGVHVNEFSLGMGPKIVSWISPRSATAYSLRALPIGGFCAMEGEDGKSSEAGLQREFRERRADAQGSSASFQAKGPWRRLAIVLAGPVANFILAYAILLVGAVSFGVATADAPPVVAEVTAHSPAQRAGVAVGDSIVAIDGAPVTSSVAAIDRLHHSLGKLLHITFERHGARTTLALRPAPCPASTGVKLGCIGILPSPGYVHESLFAALRDANGEYAQIVNETLSSLGLLITHFTQYAGQMSGVVGMGQAAVVIQQIGWGPYFVLAATISFALGLFNLFPIPGLDGGRAAFIVGELLRGKPVDPDKEALVHIAGLAALVVLMVVIAFHDIARIVSGKGVL
jgi:regulator of sigma E protease